MGCRDESDMMPSPRDNRPIRGEQAEVSARCRDQEVEEERSQWAGLP